MLAKYHRDSTLAIMPFYSETLTAREIDIAQDYALRAAMSVEHKLRDNFGKVSYTEKAPGDWVTAYDTWAQDEIQSNLKKFGHDIPIIGEEGESIEPPTEGLYWTIDPIDGTKRFVNGEEGCSTMIALVDNDVPVLGLIYDFINRRTFSATSNLRMRAGRSLSNVGLLGPSRKTMSDEAVIEMYADISVAETVAREIKNLGATMLRRSCAGLTLSDVARGKTEGFLSVNNPHAAVWDVAPGALIIAMAGGIVQNIGSDDFKLSDPNFIAANKYCAPPLQQVVAGVFTSN